MKDTSLLNVQIVLRIIKAHSDASLHRPLASMEDDDDDMRDDDVSDWRSTARDDISVSSQSTRKGPLDRQRSLEGAPLTSEEFEEIVLETLRWLHAAWKEYPLDVRLSSAHNTHLLQSPRFSAALSRYEAEASLSTERG